MKPQPADPYALLKWVLAELAKRDRETSYPRKDYLSAAEMVEPYRDAGQRKAVKR